MIDFLCLLKKYIKVLFRELESFFLVISCFICLLFKKKYIIVSAWCKYNHLGLIKKDKLIHNNWGDDINVYFLELISGKRVLIYPDTRISRMLKKILRPKCLFFIGSVLTDFSLEKSIVAGSGIMNDKIEYSISGNPSCIHFVRGPLTRNILIDKGIKCPEKYGDPALLLPCFYTPKKKKHYKIGFIPHYQDYQSEFFVNIFGKSKDNDFCFIKMRDYFVWTDVIDDITSCDFIISSSLHGLIISETYNIPSAWVHFGQYVDGWDFKFYDFYYSIGKKYIKPIDLYSVSQLWDMYEHRDNWKKGEINYTELIDTCKNIGLIK